MKKRIFICLILSVAAIFNSYSKTNNANKGNDFSISKILNEGKSSKRSFVTNTTKLINILEKNGFKYVRTTQGDWKNPSLMDDACCFDILYYKRNDIVIRIYKDKNSGQSGKWASIDILFYNNKEADKFIRSARAIGFKPDDPIEGSVTYYLKNLSFEYGNLYEGNKTIHWFQIGSPNI